MAGTINLTNGHEYYVDATLGNDSNAGYDSNHPWKTIAKVNAASLVPGDHVLFKRGETFAGQLTPVVSGTAASWITYGAYGTGDRPVIDGISARALVITSSYHYLRYESIHFYRSSGVNESAIPWSSHLYFYDCETSYAGGLGFTCWSSDGGDIYDVTIDHCIFHHNFRSGLYIGCAEQPGPHDVMVVDCESYLNGWGQVPGAGVGNGFYIKGGVTLLRCYSHDNIEEGGLKTNAIDDTTPATIYLPVVYDCISIGDKDGLYCASNGSKFYNNIVISPIQAGIVFDGIHNIDDGSEIYFNTFVNVVNSGMITLSNGHEGLHIRNNLVIQDAAVENHYILNVSGASTLLSQVAADNDFDYNTYYADGSTTSHKWYQPTISGGSLDWTEWQALGADAHSTYLSAVPDVVSYTDPRPYTPGNLLGLGLAIAGYEIDYNGDTRTDPPQAGAYNTPVPLTVAFSSGTTIDSHTIEVTFSRTILATNYATGVTIKIGAASAEITGAARQVDTTKVRYTITETVAEGNTLTWEYNDDGAADYSNSNQTWYMADVSSQSVTNTIVTTLFDITHETGDTSQYTSMVSDDCTVSGTAALVGSYGLLVTLDDTTVTYGVKSGLNSQTGILRVRFYLHPHTLTMATFDQFYLVACYNNAAARVCNVNLQYNAGYRLIASMVDDASADQSITAVTITDAAHYVEFMLTRASSAIAADGRLDWWIDGDVQTAKTDIDNYDKFPQWGEIRIGAVVGVDAGTTGTFFLDDIKGNNSGDEIGAAA